MKPDKVEFLTGAADLSSLPKTQLPAVAFAGRSNVGKSSLINAILNRKNIARTSKTPGKTRRINYFMVNEKLHLVDFPGYGFAKVSTKMQQEWRRLIEDFLTENNLLCLVIVIIDIRRGVTHMDSQLLDWLDYMNIRAQIVLTKCDKVSKNTAMNAQREIIRQRLLANEPILFSAVKRAGVSDVWEAISTACSVKL